MRWTSVAKSSLWSWLDRKRVVAIQDCYHYRGFRYGGFGNNPYEDFIIGLARGAPLQTLRSDFAQSLIRNRPATMGEALQLDIEPQPLWEYPWSNLSKRPISPVRDPHDNPDIVCHYCEKGVLASHINREFTWLEGRWNDISANGYQPGLHSFIRVLELVGVSATTYLVLDGNHRISALQALGIKEVVVRVASSRVQRALSNLWPAVKQQRYTHTDALSVFDRYSWKRNPRIGSLRPAELIFDETPRWHH